MVEGPELGGSEGDLGLGALQDVADLVVAVDGHDRHQRRAGADRGQVDDDELVPIRQLGEHAVSGLDAELTEPCRQAIRLTSSLAVGQASDAVGDQLAVGRLVRPAIETVEKDFVSPPALGSEPRGLLVRVAEPDPCISQRVDHLRHLP